MLEPVEPPAFRTDETPAGLRVTIPARRRLSALLSLLVWLSIWIPAGVYALTSDTPVVPHAGVGLGVWIVLWAVGTLFALSSLLWQLGGREVLTVGHETLTYEATAFGLGRRRVWRSAEIRRLRVAIAETTLASTRRHGRTMPPWATSYGALALDHGGRALRFAPSLDETQATQLLLQLRARLPATATGDGA